MNEPIALENQTDNEDIDSDIRSLEPNLADINEHLYAIFAPDFVAKYPDAWIEIASSDPSADDNGVKAGKSFSPLSELDKAAAHAVRINKQGRNVYVGMALRQGSTGPSGRATRANVLTTSRTWDDFDQADDAKRVAEALKANDIEYAELVITGTIPHPRFQLAVAVSGDPNPDQIEALNAALKDRLGGDNVQNCDRVMRLAGTVNYPTPKKVERGYVPELTKLTIVKNRRAYDSELLLRKLRKDDEPRPSTPGGIGAEAPKTNRSFSRKVNEAALANLSAWVPEVFGKSAEFQKSTGAYRVKSDKLGRNLEEDLSISPKGITDWGEDDMGKRGKKDARFTAIDIVIRYAGAPDPTAAAFWLCKCMAIDPKAFGWKDRGVDEEPNEEPLRAEDAIDPWAEAPAPRLDMGLLPDVVRRAAEISARVSGADVDAFAVGYLTGLAACIDTRNRLNPKMRSNDWAPPLVLWIILVAPPSSMKSEIVKAARALAASLDNTERRRYDSDVSSAKTGTMLRAIPRDGKPLTKSELKDLKDEEKEAVARVRPPRQRVCADVTTEKLVDLLGANPGGISVFRDELSGWVDSLGKYSGGKDGGDRAFYCAFRDGTAYDRQRMSKDNPDVHLPYCAGSFFGAVQMDRLRDMKLPFSDGLFQRFMPLIMREARSYSDDETVEESEDAKALLKPLRDILSMIPPSMAKDAYGEDVPVPYRLDAEGAVLFIRFAEDMREAAKAGYPSREFGECLTKMGPMWLSLALLFHFIEEDSVGPSRTVAVDTARRADTIMRDYFVPHCAQFYLKVTDGGEQLRSLACAILRCPKDDIVLRDVVRRCHMMRNSGKMKRNDQIALMQRFEMLGWLVRLDRNGSTPRWKRTKGLGERFAEDLKREVARRNELRRLIKLKASQQKAGDTGED